MVGANLDTQKEWSQLDHRSPASSLCFPRLRGPLVTRFLLEAAAADGPRLKKRPARARAASLPVECNVLGRVLRLGTLDDTDG